ncbi:hypothetical protein [Calothrix sp. UHCC 0171]|uniref:hypothetical protein n=1 Tax=Calothrix sp. UHCC 0171 TaxID=3110245 RepID=UPI002B21EDD7|nr:hypothetical protein [Calothrix sp. UHCC 0171]MEA5572707.1 hypothetical protein [Calothrix sp. UHCC 0171]
MRHEVMQKLKNLLKERKIFNYKDGYVYGCLNNEFELTSDELHSLAKVLGFKYGWNSTVEEILESQWQEESDRIKELKRAKEIRDLEQKKNKLANEIKYLNDKVELDQTIQKLLMQYKYMKLVDSELTDVERGLIGLILKMNNQEQLQILEIIYKRFY